MHSTITFIAFESSLEISIVALRDLFAAAERAAGRNEVLTRADARGACVVTQDGAPVRTFSGSMLRPDGAVGDVDSTRLIAVSGVWGRGVGGFGEQRTTMAWLVEQYQRGAIIACLHSGAFLVAETGLLDGRPACVYWRLEAAFRARYPAVLVDAERKITESDRIYCASGIGSTLTLGVFLIEQLYGSAVADKVSRNFLMEGERQTAEFVLAFDRYKRHTDDKVLAAQAWLENHLSSDFLIEELADRLGLGMRTLSGRFRSATGVTVLAYLQLVRVETAKGLLRNTRLTVDHIAYRVGYRDATHFGRVFKRLAGQAPRAYRERSD